MNDVEYSFNELSSEVSYWLMPRLQTVFSAEEKKDKTVEAAEYSLFAGGKRIRPCIMYASAQMLGLDCNEILEFAAALEMIHTYSLIHDDLPCMDNDDLRRGKMTCHIKYGEGIALLAGDCLLNRAYEILLKASSIDHKYAYASYKIAKLAGICGMIGGQSLDLCSIDKKIDLNDLYKLHSLKTGALMEAAVCTPFFVLNSDKDIHHVTTDSVLVLLKRLSMHIGLSFQIRDDILDLVSDSATLGKSIGKDSRDNKPTFVTELSYDEACSKLARHIGDCEEILEIFSTKGYDITMLKTIVHFLERRNS